MHYYWVSFTERAKEIVRTTLLALMVYLSGRRHVRTEKTTLEKDLELLPRSLTDNSVISILLECELLFQAEAVQWLLAYLTLEKDYKTIRSLLSEPRVKTVMHSISSIFPTDNIAMIILNQEGNKSLCLDLYEPSELRVMDELFFVGIMAFEAGQYEKSIAYFRTFLSKRGDVIDETLVGALQYIADSMSRLNRRG